MSTFEEQSRSSCVKERERAVSVREEHEEMEVAAASAPRGTLGLLLCYLLFSRKEEDGGDGNAVGITIKS